MTRTLTIPSDEVVASLDDRMHHEDPPSTRTQAQRDRDRILYSSAFLRLGHVTQVAAPEVGHAFHSRLTHSIKVAQVARGLAQRLKTERERDELDNDAARLVDALDEDATEAAALAHDLGHPPFGHLAERVLDAESRKGHASFEGNPQSFRIVTQLALRSEVPPGLNLTRRTLNGLLKYPWTRKEEPPEKHEKWGAYDADELAFEWTRRGIPGEERTLEAQLMDWADDVTYAVHDMDDFYRAGLVPLDRLVAEDDERGRFVEYLRKKAKDEADANALETAAGQLFDGPVALVRTRYAGHNDERIAMRHLGSWLIGIYIAAPKLRGSDDHQTVVWEVEHDVANQVRVLKQLTWFYIIERPSLAVIQRGHEQIVRTLYLMYRSALDEGDLSLFPPAFEQRVANVGESQAARERIVVDLIAGMTEASATELYRQQMGISTGSIIARAAGPA